MARSFKNKNYFTLDNFKYGQITLKFVGRYFYLIVTIFSKKRAILVQKLGEEKKCQNPFRFHMHYISVRNYEMGVTQKKKIYE